MILRSISRDCGLRQSYLEQLAKTASHRYKTYQIKKRTKGYRTIEHPARELKLVQRWLISNVFEDLPVHDSVFSYQRGRNIARHARIHAKKSFLMRIDFTDFFPSIRAIDIAKLLERRSEDIGIELSKRDIRTITMLVCKDRALTIGAPSSPILSNAVLYDFDCVVDDHCRNLQVKYSRYADDLYFSTSAPNTLSQIFEFVRTTLKTMKSPRLKINWDKTVYTSRKRERRVTGLILTPDKKVSLGRDKKRYIRSLVYKYGKNEVSKKKVAYLQGYLAYAESVEPSFILSLEKKYGKKLLNKIRE